MGCVQAKPSMHSPPRGLEKLKLESGYVGRGEHVRPRRSTGQRPHELREKNAAGRRLSDANRDTINERINLVITNEGGKKQTNENNDVGRKVTKTTTTTHEEEELIDGWPKWLVDNIPREVLAGLVPKSADSYEKIDKVGSGTYSNVYRAQDRDTGMIVALKKVRFDTSEPESIRFMAREIMILQKLDHPNIIKLEGLATSRMHYSLYIVFEYMQSDLTSIISRPDMRLSEAQIKCYMQQLLSGLQHCHERGILHRDIKGSNLLIDKNGMLKIADFGLANHFNPEKERPLTSRVVTLWYRAPELLLGATDYGVGIDLWSAGCLMAEMFAGRPILPGRTEFFSTSPLACELSELPVVYKEDPVAALKLERRRHKTRQRSQSLKERKKEVIDEEETKPDDVGSNEEPIKSRLSTVFRLLEPGSSSTTITTTTTTSTSSSTSKLTEKSQSSPRSAESHPNSTTNIKNKPPLPNARRNRTNKYNKNNNSNKDAMNRLSRDQRSQSSKDFSRS
ncbi:hypothetical protein RDI58_011410 [Solanum bulbocastanum]|uniref:Protein kinase domain-containing protein n=1 Tax=Solanum bulbocastanum TaxID=147425 RepID=A0AAN8TRA9_SOLBU